MGEECRKSTVWIRSNVNTNNIYKKRASKNQ